MLTAGRERIENGIEGQQKPENVLENVKAIQMKQRSLRIETVYYQERYCLLSLSRFFPDCGSSDSFD